MTVDHSVLQGVRVLLVDDHPDLRAFLSLALRRCGAQVITAPSALKAFEVFQQSPPDVLISDISMPEEDGYSLVRKVRSLPPQAGGLVPAIALTGHESGQDVEVALAAGFQVHLVKPVDWEDLVAEVARLIRS